MATTMNTSGYEIEREVVTADEYGDEITCPEWNPQLEVARDCPARESDKHAAVAHALANVDIDAFLQEMYKFQP